MPTSSHLAADFTRAEAALLPPLQRLFGEPCQGFAADVDGRSYLGVHTGEPISDRRDFTADEWAVYLKAGPAGSLPELRATLEQRQGRWCLILHTDWVETWDNPDCIGSPLVAYSTTIAGCVRLAAAELNRWADENEHEASDERCAEANAATLSDLRRTAEVAAAVWRTLNDHDEDDDRDGAEVVG